MRLKVGDCANIKPHTIHDHTQQRIHATMIMLVVGYSFCCCCCGSCCYGCCCCSLAMCLSKKRIWAPHTQLHRNNWSFCESLGALCIAVNSHSTHISYNFLARSLARSLAPIIKLLAMWCLAHKSHVQHLFRSFDQFACVEYIYFSEFFSNSKLTI